MTKISIFKIVSVTRLPKVPLVRLVGLIIDIDFFLVFDICFLEFICYLLFAIWYLLFGTSIQNLFSFIDGLYLVFPFFLP